MSKAKFQVGYLAHAVTITSVRRPDPAGCLVVKEGDVLELSPEEVEHALAVLPKGTLKAVVEPAKASEGEGADGGKAEDKKPEDDPFAIPGDAKASEGEGKKPKK